MSDRLSKYFQILVVGAGPAGLAAAASASSRGARVGVLDDNPHPGGQIWRSDRALENLAAKKWLDKLRTHEVEVMTGATVVHQGTAARSLFAEMDGGLVEIAFSKLILATGARECMLPFPGWTLPNVMTAGGLQSMLKSGLEIAGKRVVVAGSGPLLLAVAAYLRKRRATVLAICEQAPWAALARFAAAMWRYPGKIREALTLGRDLRGIPFWAGSWVLEALGDKRLDRVLVSRRGKKQELVCDYLACGFHLVPNSELATLIGCELRDGFVNVDEQQRTSVPNVFCAGEPTGIAGIEVSLLEGQIAGFSAAGAEDRCAALRSQWRKYRAFTRRLRKTFPLRSELKALPDANTIVCRCEDVIYARAMRHVSWRDAKNQSRCGMGPCQGRICGPATGFLFDWQSPSVRPPIYPVRIGNLALLADSQEPQTGGNR